MPHRLPELPSVPKPVPLIRQVPVLLLLAGFVLVIGIVVAVAVFTFGVRSNTREVNARYQTIMETAGILDALRDAETGQRGFLITGDEGYLRPYEESVTTLSARVDALEARIVDPALHVDVVRLHAIVDAKADEMARTIALFRAGDPAGAIAIVNGDEGRQLMDEARDLIGAITVREQAYRQAAFDTADRLAQRLLIGVIAAALCVTVLGAFAISDARRRYRELIEHAAAIRERNILLRDANLRLTEEMEIREAAEKQLQQMHKVEAVGQLTGGIAHDFNNMLAVILSALSLAQRRMKAGVTDVGQFLDAAADAARRAADLTQRLLAFSRQQPLSPQVVDVNRLVAGMSELLHRTLGEAVQLETVLAGGLWRTHADPSPLENAILNLAVNARDAMPEGGRITIETANAWLDDAYARVNPGAEAGQYVMIAVTDTGSGMPAEVVARAFDPFFTTKAAGKGTGLGLSQVHGFVKQSGGHIKIYSEPGQGTTVKIYLPRTQAEESPVAAAPVAGDRPQSRAGELVLVVEDDDRVRAMTEAALGDLGYAVIAADSAEAAMALLRDRPEVALLFTDIVMPVTNGRKLSEMATAERPGLKVLFTTGFTRNAVVHNGILDAGVNFLPKPFTLEQLARKVRSVLDA
ncbi:MAG: CHASE3 domain-containing protein [Rhizobiales bacterium]|nr:CHASE3 domain-containing protein [Hyphomicrobiales bacterium]